MSKEVNNDAISPLHQNDTSIFKDPKLEQASEGISPEMSKFAKDLKAKGEKAENSKEVTSDQEGSQDESRKEEPVNVKKPDGILTTILKALLKMVGLKFDDEEDKNKDVDKDAQKIIDFFKNLFGIGKVNSQDLQGGGYEKLLNNDNLQDQNTSNKKDEEEIDSVNNPLHNKTQSSNSNPIQDPSDNKNTKENVVDPAVNQGSDTSQDNKLGEKDKAFIGVLVSLASEKGQLDLLKGILEDMKKEAGEDNKEMKGFFDEFDTKISEVEKEKVSEKDVDKEIDDSETKNQPVNESLANENDLIEFEKLPINNNNNEVLDEKDIEIDIIDPEEKKLEDLNPNKEAAFNFLNNITEEELEKLKEISSKLVDKGVTGGNVEEGENNDRTEAISQDVANRQKNLVRE